MASGLQRVPHFRAVCGHYNQARSMHGWCNLMHKHNHFLKAAKLSLTVARCMGPLEAGAAAAACAAAPAAACCSAACSRCLVLAGRSAATARNSAAAGLLARWVSSFTAMSTSSGVGGASGAATSISTGTSRRSRDAWAGSPPGLVMPAAAARLTASRPDLRASATTCTGGQ